MTTPTLTAVIAAANAAYQVYTQLVDVKKVDRQTAAQAALAVYLEKVHEPSTRQA